MMMMMMRRWSAPFDKCYGDVTLQASNVTAPLLASDDDDDDDVGDCEIVQPRCTAAEDRDVINDDDDDDEVFETGWPARAKDQTVDLFLHH